MREVNKRFTAVVLRRIREAPDSKTRRTIRELAMKCLERRV